MLRSIVAFVSGLIVLMLFYYFVSIPVLPCVSIYIAGEFLDNNKSHKLRIFFIIMLGLIGMGLYSLNAVYLFRSENFHVLNVTLSIINAIACFGAMNYSIMLQLGNRHSLSQ